MKPRAIISVPQSPLMNFLHFWKKGSFEKISARLAASQLSS
jgi:hypothetical protein